MVGELRFRFALRGKEGEHAHPDEAFYHQWATSPFADTYLTKLAEAAVDALGLGKRGATDYLGVSYSSVDYVGHTFGPRSWEIQDMLVRLDKDLGELFAHLDQKVGRGNYVVALTADHGVAPIPAANAEDRVRCRRVEHAGTAGADWRKHWSRLTSAKPAIARMAGNEIYFSPGIYDQLRHDPAAMKAVLDAALSTPGVAEVFRAEELGGGFKTAIANADGRGVKYYAPRSGDLYVLQQPYWLGRLARGCKTLDRHWSRHALLL